MTGRSCIFAMAAALWLVAGCDEGINDWNSSAKIVGDVYTNPSHSQGVEGVRVILESDADADNPYEGPDRWTVTDSQGHFTGAVFLGNHAADGGSYTYVADLSVSYFWHDKAFSWNGGVTVSPGSVFTLPAVDTTMFVPLTGTGQ